MTSDLQLMRIYRYIKVWELEYKLNETKLNSDYCLRLYYCVNYAFVLKMKRHGINVRNTALQLREKRRILQIERYPQGFQQRWSTTACEKLKIARN